MSRFSFGAAITNEIRLNVNDMLLPDETYEDYKKRINSQQLTTQVTTVGYNSLAFTKHFIGNRTNSAENKKKIESKSSSSKDSGACSSDDNLFKHSEGSFADSGLLAIPSSTLLPQAQEQQQQSDKYDNPFTIKWISKHVNNTSKNKNKPCLDDLAANPIFLHTCKSFIHYYKLRPDFFCQYYKAIGPTRTLPAGKYSKCSGSSRKRQLSISLKSADIYKQQKSINGTVEHFVKRSAIYTLPVPKRKADGIKKYLSTLKTGASSIK